MDAPEDAPQVSPEIQPLVHPDWLVCDRRLSMERDELPEHTIFPGKGDEARMSNCWVALFTAGGAGPVLE